MSKVQKASTSGTAQSIGRVGGRQAAGSSGPPSAARKASPARRLANSVMPATVKSTKKSAANDNLTKLKERLVRGERLTEDELVQLELAAVSRYDALQRQDESRQEGSSSIAVSSNAGRSSSGRSGKTGSRSRSPQGNVGKRVSFDASAGGGTEESPNDSQRRNPTPSTAGMGGVNTKCTYYVEYCPCRCSIVAVYVTEN